MDGPGQFQGNLFSTKHGEVIGALNPILDIGGPIVRIRVCVTDAIHSSTRVLIARRHACCGCVWSENRERHEPNQKVGKGLLSNV